MNGDTGIVKVLRASPKSTIEPNANHMVFANRNKSLENPIQKQQVNTLSRDTRDFTRQIFKKPNLDSQSYGSTKVYEALSL